MGRHEKEALERERRELLRTVCKSQAQGRRLDEIELLIGAEPTPNKLNEEGVAHE